MANRALSTLSASTALSAPTHLRAHTPWRDAAYDLAVDARVDTTFHHRSRHFATTAATIAALHASAASCVAVFFPSYAYADSIARLITAGFPLRVAVQPKLRDLAAQSAWVDESLALADALSIPVIASGGLASLDDVKRLLEPDCVKIAGAITGRALYDGRLDPQLALDLIRSKKDSPCA